MDTCVDTGTNVPESEATLLIQQKGLLEGRRAAQMFPKGTPELALPEGMQRFVNHRGVFHFNPQKINRHKLATLSAQGRENEFLNLGPHSKYDVKLMNLAGDSIVCVTEYTADGVEVRSAVSTVQKAEGVRRFFEDTKEQGSSIVVGEPPARIRNQ